MKQKGGHEKELIRLSKMRIGWSLSETWLPEKGQLIKEKNKGLPSNK